MEIKKTNKVEYIPRVTGDVKERRGGKGSKKNNGRKPGKEGAVKTLDARLQRGNLGSTELRSMAAALKYDPGIDFAPQVSALGKGVIAENILKLAREANVPVYKDEKLVNTLSALRVGDEIPRELFEIVAEVLVFISKTDMRYGKKFQNL